MQNISDIIEVFIKDMLKQCDGELELRRNELAVHFNCAPSQINYVLATRFSVNRGYLITSRKGGGGYIRITSINMASNEYILHMIKSIGDNCTQSQALQVISGLEERELISKREYDLMAVAISDDSLKDISSAHTRADILKNMLSCLFEE